MKHYTIRRGARPAADPAPVGAVEEAGAVGSVAVLGRDWPGLRPHMEVEPGARVVRGQTLFTDRRARSVCFVAPVSGVVETLTFGPRRSLDALILRADPEPGGPIQPGAVPDRAEPREALLRSGLWPAFRTRPYGGIPAPDAVPEAIVVNAVRPAPQAPDPATVLASLGEVFHTGCKVLTDLTEGPVHVCQSPGAPLGPEYARVLHASFSGTRAAGLPGTQIDRLCRGQAVWSIGYQDVAAIGVFFETGDYPGTRVMSIAGPMAEPPRLVRAPIGARVSDLVGPVAARAVTGGAVPGRSEAFLGRFDDQITLLPPVPRKRPRVLRSRLTGHSAAIPSRALDTAVAVDVLTLPLLRALSIGDTEAAQRLGCLGLIEEDLAAATERCTSGIDYGACLRGILDDLEADAT